jgi:two-component system, NtrC family, sensor kinase
MFSRLHFSLGLAASARPVGNARIEHGVTLSSLRHTWKVIGLLGWSMLASVASVAILAYWDARRESEAALADFAQEQQTLAVALAMDVRDRLHVASKRASFAEILHGLRNAQRPRANVIALLPPGAREFVVSDGRAMTLDALRGEFLAGHTSARLTRETAASLGLPARTALAGLARVEDDDNGTWGVVAVASAERERDRELWAKWRLVLSVITAAGLVSAFGGLALRKQKRGLALQNQVLLAQTRQEADERLQTASKAATLGTLAMGVAHEIATPLGVISLRAEQLAAKLAGEERGSAAAHAIIEQCERITLIIRGLLGLARGGKLATQEIDPRTLVEASIVMVAHRFAQSRVTIDTKSSADIPRISGDSRLLEQALINLLLNACDASPPGALVRVSLATDTEMVLLSVVDQGPGISHQDVDRALQPFFTTKPDGTGLGLAVAREIVNSHRGTLTLAPESPRGTKAVIRLPILGHDNG